MPEDRKTFSDLAHEALARDPNWLYGEVLPIAKNRQTGEYSAALPGMIRDYLGGWADLITGPQVGENLSPQAVLSILGPGAHAAAGSPSVVIGPGARAFNWAKAFRSPIAGADEIARNAVDDSPLMFSDKQLLLDHPYKLNDVIEHPELFTNYPDLKDLNINFPSSMRGQGAFDPLTNTVSISSRNSSDRNMLQTILHETQHWIQGFEGMQKGNNPDNYLPKNFSAVVNSLKELFPIGRSDLPVEDFRKELQNMYHTAFNRYERAPGEMEARAVGNAFSAQEPFEDYLPSPFNFLDLDPSQGLPFTSTLRQQYSPNLDAYAKLLEEYLKK